MSKVQEINHKIKLKQVFGYDSFRDKQHEIINALLRGQDVCAIMFTGAGKSLCFQFPPIYENKLAIVVSPLISLMNDQCMKLVACGIPACCINSEMEYSKKNTILQELRENKYRLMYTTPEYLVKQKYFVTKLYEEGTLLLAAIDEAHCCSSWGNDFRLDYRKLFCLKEWCPTLPVIALTATATTIVQKDIIDTLQLNNPLIIKTTFNRDNLFISVRPKSEDPLADIIPLIVDPLNKPVIIYCGTRSNTDAINELLKASGIICDSYHAGMDPVDKMNVHNKFVNNEIDCVVATIAFGMGIDKPIRTVVHYCVPLTLEAYYQEIGRAGRDGILSNCILFKSSKDLQIDHYIINKIEDNDLRDYKMKLLSTVKQFISTTSCRRKIILEYFGEKYEVESCGLCDNCTTDKNKLVMDFSDSAKLVLGVIKATGSSYGATMICNILRGSKSSQIQKKHTQLNEYGKGKDKKLEWWKPFIDLLVNHGYLKQYTISGGRGCILALTDIGSLWLRKYDKLELPVPEELRKYYKENSSKITEKVVTNDHNESQLTNSKKVTPTDYKYTDSVKMFKEGSTIDQIAKYANVKSVTIENHLVKCYEQGLDIDLEKINLTNDLIVTVSQILNNNEFATANLSTIKKLLPKETTYLQIKFVKAIIERNTKNLDMDTTNNTGEEKTEESQLFASYSFSSDDDINACGHDSEDNLNDWVIVETGEKEEEAEIDYDFDSLGESSDIEHGAPEEWEDYDPLKFGPDIIYDNSHNNSDHINTNEKSVFDDKYYDLLKKLKKNLDTYEFTLEPNNNAEEEIYYEED